MFALHVTPLKQEGVPVQPTLQLVCPHVSLPPHAEAPLQQRALCCAPLCTVPEHDGEPLQSMVQLVAAVQPTLPLHACSPHAIVHASPPHVTLPRHAATSHVTLH